MKDRNGVEIQPGDKVKIEHIGPPDAHSKAMGVNGEVTTWLISEVEHLTESVVIVKPLGGRLIPVFGPGRIEVIN